MVKSTDYLKLQREKTDDNKKSRLNKDWERYLKDSTMNEFDRVESIRMKA
jgi:hypothetical protein